MLKNNVLDEIAVWKHSYELPGSSGLYLISNEKHEKFHWCFDAEKKHWGDGLHTPGKNFRWLNVRIKLEVE